MHPESVKGKLIGSWANSAFDMESSFPVLRLNLVQAAKQLVVELHRRSTGGNTK